ncbi:MAG: hypothetical protein IIA51_09305 [Chloroflexi bacterium]|nr:hypothetical protein [Chloroflexota bacterium]MDK1044897.1 hypothetical protein [Anaerolineales bacterium]MCH8341733.1 hypothetical protein [Chloroflexota bacterium]MCI0773533.1 hypothetical protein [Chloroflexota bacterium]MCI0806434.1 hypothetical protein [Chloroflexota bacterium]
MISLTVLFGLLVIIFGIIGAMRGWAKELLVTSAIVLGLFLNSILASYIQPYQTLMVTAPPGTILSMQAGVLLLLAFFGYQTPKIQALQPKLVRERFEEILLGGFMGLLNGFLLVGSIWFYLHQTGYATTDLVIAPEGELAEQIEGLMAYMPPSLLPIPHVFFAVGVVFVFIIVVFV